MHCRFFLPGPGGGCGEGRAEKPAEKDRANFCDWFSLNPKYRGATPGQRRDRAAAASAHSAFEDLFK
jgi:hypothetical protein